MNSITEFKSEFSRVMRGYSPSEVDEAIEMLVSYAADLEQANAEFADANEAMGVQNDALIASQQTLSEETDALRQELEALRAEVENYRAKVGDANRFVAEAKQHADDIRAEAERESAALRAEQLRQTEAELKRLQEVCRAEEARYADICRCVSTLTSSVRTLWGEHLEALDSLETMIPAEKVCEAEPEIKPAAESAKKPDTFGIRRAAIAAAVVEAEEPDAAAPCEEPESKRPESEPIENEDETDRPQPIFSRAIRRPLPNADVTGETIEFTSVKVATMNNTAKGDSHPEGISVDTVYRPATPATMKITRVQDTSSAPTHSYSAVRRSLEDINSRMK